MKFKRGMSGIMAALILLLLVLIIIGIVWRVVLPMIESTSESVETEYDTLKSCADNGGFECEKNQNCLKDGAKIDFVIVLDTSRCCLGDEDCYDCSNLGGTCTDAINSIDCCGNLICNGTNCGEPLVS